MERTWRFVALLRAPFGFSDLFFSTPWASQLTQQNHEKILPVSSIMGTFNSDKTKSAIF